MMLRRSKFLERLQNFRADRYALYTSKLLAYVCPLLVHPLFHLGWVGGVGAGWGSSFGSFIDTYDYLALFNVLPLITC